MIGPSHAAQTAALALVKEYGWHVFRLHIGHDEAKCDGGKANCKTVATINHEKWRRASSNDPAVVAGWDWSGANAYGIDCGKSGLVVADEDPGATWPFNGTRVHSTGRGLHHIYEDVVGLAIRNGAHVAPWGIDIRSDGGMVIGPGSWHPHGRYAVVSDQDPAPVPEELVKAVLDKPAQRPAVTPAEAGPLDALEALDRLEGVYRRMAAAPQGQRNHTLNNMAGTAAALWVRLDEADQRGLLDPDHIRKRLLESVPNEDDPAQSEATFDSGWAYGLEHPIVDEPSDFASGFFDETPVLQHIRQAAHARGVKAPVVLASVLGYVLLGTEPDVMLPPVVGSPASLNLGFALVGDSGASKSTSADVAAELLGRDTDSDEVLPIGSGEGMIDAFYEWVEVPRDPERPEGATRLELQLLPEVFRRRMFLVDEGETLKKLADRSGTTLAGFLRTALTGGMLGTTNAKTGGRSRRVPAKSYRLVMIAVIHPDQADVLLDGDGVGMPQRFLWVPANDPSLPTDVADLPQWPGPLQVKPQPLGLGELSYPAHIKREVQQANLDREHGGADARLAHANLTRLKVAQALAMLHGEPEITDQWWRLAGMLSAVSLSVQDMCMARLADNHQTKVTARFKAEARAVESVDEDRLSRAVKAVVERLRKRAGETLSWGEAKPAYRLTKDLPTDEILEALRGQVGVTVEVRTAKNGGEAYDLRYDD